MNPRYWIRQLYVTLMLLLAPLGLAGAVWTHGPAGWGWWAASGLLAAFLTVYGYNVGSHYAFAHRLFRFPRPVELLLIYTSTISAGASPLSWAIYHIAHHRYSDTEHDPHSPAHRGWKVLFPITFRSEKATPLSAKHLLNDPAQRFADSNAGFWVITASWPVAAGLIGGLNGLVYLWLIPVWYVLAVGVVFVVSHFGPLDDKSRSRAINAWWLGLLSLGDGGHLAHHRNMKSCGRWTRRFASLLGATSRDPTPARPDFLNTVPLGG